MRTGLSALVTGAIAAAAMLLAPAASAQPWNGFYVGANAGGGMGASHFGDGCYYCATDDSNPAFVTVGGQAGFNWQMGAAVLGFEGDMDWSSLTHHGILGNDDDDFLVERQKLDWDASIRARAGIAVDNALFYLTAGPAFGHISAPGVEFCCEAGNPSATPDGITFSESDTRVGVTGGVGLEWMYDDTWSLGIEYLYTDYGTATAHSNPSDACDSEAGACTVHNSLTTQTIRAKLNFHT